MQAADLTSAHQIYLLNIGIYQGALFTGFPQVVLVASQFFIRFTVVVLSDVHVIWKQSIWESFTAFEIGKNTV